LRPCLRFRIIPVLTDWATLSHSSRQQNTIAGPVRVSGFGYWSGLDVCVEFRPAAANTGIVFVRTDEGHPHRIQAIVSNRVEIPRRTTLQTPHTTVEMVEHVMASLAGLQIDNCEVWVDRAEMPGCDGSSLPFVEALLATRRVTQPVMRRRIVVGETIRVGDGQCWVEARPPIAPGLSISYQLDYGSEGPIGRQHIDLPLSPQTFCSELASARTFILKHEAQWLREQGFGERVTCSDLLVFNDTGPVDNELRYEDECVRHKALDLVGDLALAGCDIEGHIVAYRSGHRLNAELVRAVLATCVPAAMGRCA
jgi:UDP-3-O-acyl N-acetylglucosamine deacetylase